MRRRAPGRPRSRAWRASTRPSRMRSAAASKSTRAIGPPLAWAVAAALPGGDPLAAALAAGRMPSPEMIAAAGQKRRAAAGSRRGRCSPRSSRGRSASGCARQRVTQIDPARISEAARSARRARAQRCCRAIGHAAGSVGDTEHWFEHTRHPLRVPPESRNTSISQNSMHVVIERDPPNDVAGDGDGRAGSDGRLIRLTRHAARRSRRRRDRR